MALLVRDEEDVIDATIACHLVRGVDHVIVTDNGSTDCHALDRRTLCRRGCATLIDEPGVVPRTKCCRCGGSTDTRSSR